MGSVANVIYFHISHIAIKIPFSSQDQHAHKIVRSFFFKCRGIKVFSDVAKPVQGAAYSISVTCQPYQTCIDLQSVVHDLGTYFLLNKTH